MNTALINFLGTTSATNNWQNTQKIDLIDDKYFYVTAESKFFLFQWDLVLEKN